MTKGELAVRLDGREYGKEIDRLEGDTMSIKLNILYPKAHELFVIGELAHIVGDGNYERDEQDLERWWISPTSNNWWARIEDGILSINGRYADDATMQAVKQMLLFRCESDVKEL